jgi:hypothetical protein
VDAYRAMEQMITSRAAQMNGAPMGVSPTLAQRIRRRPAHGVRSGPHHHSRWHAQGRSGRRQPDRRRRWREQLPQHLLLHARPAGCRELEAALRLRCSWCGSGASGPVGMNDSTPTALTDAACDVGTGARRHDAWAGRDGCHHGHQLEGRRRRLASGRSCHGARRGAHNTAFQARALMVVSDGSTCRPLRARLACPCDRQALSAPEAVNSDFSVGAKQGRDFPTADEWKGLFAAA